MAVQYTNRKGDTYFLQAGKTRTGKPKYYFARKLTGAPVEAIPEGYEVRESPENAQVTLRKTKPSEISPLEARLLSDGVRRYAGLEHFIVDVEGNSLVVYLPATEEREAEKMIERLGGPWMVASMRGRAAKDEMIRGSHYLPMMRFELADPEERLFHLERWCFLGSIDHWVFLAGPAPLPDLVRQYATHLGKESFFELL